jgi:hypothetical protein
MREGGLWFLPKSWQALDAKHTNNENLWFTFLFESLKRTEVRLQKLNVVAIATYLAIALLIDTVVLRTKSKQKRGSILLQAVWRLVLTHMLVCLIAWLALSSIAQSNWARDIRNGKAYSLQVAEDKEEMDSRPMTIPLKSDILMTTAYASDVLAMYSMVVDVAHPGNRIWKELVQTSASGYSNLSETLQLHLCQSMIAWMQPERRFLKPNQYRQWQEITETTFLVDFCKREVQSASNAFTKVMLRQVDSLKDDAQNGRWRDMAIHKTTIPQYLELWEKRFFSLDSTLAKKTAPNAIPWQTFKYAQKPPSTVSPFFTQKNALPPLPESTEPYPGAWLQVGDIVEARYHCFGRHNGKFTATGVGGLWC